MDGVALSAVKSGDIGVLRRFLDKGEDYKVRDEIGWSLIYHAAYNGRFECVKLILEKARSDFKSITELVKNVLECNVDGETPLSLAARKGYSDIVELLVNVYLKCDVDYKNMGCPIHKACNHGQNNCIDVLVKTIPQYIDAHDDLNLGRCPIHITVQNSNIEGTKILMENGCNLDRKSECEETPLHLAIKRDNYELVKLIADKVKDINSCDLEDITPLHLASQFGNISIVRCLLNNGADASKTSLHEKHPFLPIDIAANFRHFELVEFLATRTPKECNKYAVPLAASSGNIERLTNLFDKGFPVFKSDTKIFGSNVWVFILESCPDNFCEEIVKILLDKEALFHDLVELVKLYEDMTDDNYFLSDIFSDICPEALAQFLDAGIIELRFDCATLPDTNSIIDKHKNNRYLKKDISRILKCLEHFPFLTWSSKNVLELPTLENFRDGDLMKSVPSLLYLTRWTIRCCVVWNKGMIHRKYFDGLNLPTKAIDYLVKYKLRFF